VSKWLNHGYKQTSINGPVEHRFSYNTAQSQRSVGHDPLLRVKTGAPRLHPCGTAEIQPRIEQSTKKCPIFKYQDELSQALFPTNRLRPLFQLSAGHANTGLEVLHVEQTNHGSASHPQCISKRSLGPSPSQTPEHPSGADPPIEMWNSRKCSPPAPRS
jgi:hypothetical protein